MKFKLKFIMLTFIVFIMALACLVGCADKLTAEIPTVKNSIYVFDDIEVVNAAENEVNSMSEEEVLSLKERLKDNYSISFFYDKCTDSFGNSYNFSEEGKIVNISKEIRGESFGGILKLYISDAGEYLSEEALKGQSCELSCIRYNEYTTVQDVADMPDYMAIKDKLCSKTNIASELDNNTIKEILLGFDINNCEFYFESTIYSNPIYLCGVTSGRKGSSVDYVYYQGLCESYCINGNFYYNFGAHWTEGEFEEYNELFKKLKTFDNSYFYDMVQISQKIDSVNGFVSKYGDIENYLKISKDTIVVETKAGQNTIGKIIIYWGDNNISLCLPDLNKEIPDKSEIEDEEVVAFLTKLENYDKENFTVTEFHSTVNDAWNITYSFDTLNGETVYKRVSDKEGDDPVLFGQGDVVFTEESYPIPVDFIDADALRVGYSLSTEFLLSYKLAVEGDNLVCKTDRGENRFTVKINGDKIIVEGKIGYSFASEKIEIYGFGTTEVVFPETM